MSKLTQNELEIKKNLKRLNADLIEIMDIYNKIPDKQKYEWTSDNIVSYIALVLDVRYG